MEICATPIEILQPKVCHHNFSGLNENTRFYFISNINHIVFAWSKKHKHWNSTTTHSCGLMWQQCHSGSSLTRWALGSGYDIKLVIFKFKLIISMIEISNISCEIALRWMPHFGLVQSGNRPLPEPMLTQISVAIWQASQVNYWCPHAKAPGHHCHENWLNIHLIRSVSYRNITFIGKNITK